MLNLNNLWLHLTWKYVILGFALFADSNLKSTINNPLVQINPDSNHHFSVDNDSTKQIDDSVTTVLLIPEFKVQLDPILIINQGNIETFISNHVAPETLKSSINPELKDQNLETIKSSTLQTMQPEPDYDIIYDAANVSAVQSSQPQEQGKISQSDKTQEAQAHSSSGAIGATTEVPLASTVMNLPKPQIKESSNTKFSVYEDWLNRMFAQALDAQ